MPADLVPNEAIHELAARVDSPEVLEVLRRVQEAGFIQNGGDVDEGTAAILRRLTELGLVDPGFEGRASGEPYLWARNGNGSRVLRYLTGIRAGPHYEIPAFELAKWLEQRGTDQWWNVDGDPLLTGRISFPCPGDELAAEVRKIGRPLLVQAQTDDFDAKGQQIGAAKLDAVSRPLSVIYASGSLQEGANDRFLYLRWKGFPHDWLLAEDSATARQVRADEQGRVSDSASVKK